MHTKFIVRLLHQVYYRIWKTEVISLEVVTDSWPKIVSELTIPSCGALHFLAAGFSCPEIRPEALNIDYND